MICYCANTNSPACELCPVMTGRGILTNKPDSVSQYILPKTLVSQSQYEAKLRSKEVFSNDKE